MTEDMARFWRAEAEALRVKAAQAEGTELEVMLLIAAEEFDKRARAAESLPSESRRPLSD